MKLFVYDTNVKVSRLGCVEAAYTDIIVIMGRQSITVRKGAPRQDCTQKEVVSDLVVTPAGSLESVRRYGAATVTDFDAISAGSLESVTVYGTATVTVHPDVLSRHRLKLTAFGPGARIKLHSNEERRILITRVSIAAYDATMWCSSVLAKHILKARQYGSGFVQVSYHRGCIRSVSEGVSVYEADAPVTQSQ